MSDRLTSDLSFIEDEADLRGRHHAPMSRATDKVLSRLDKHCRAILAAAPFCVLATQGADGADVSPRGDPPGFLKVIGDTHVLLPDRVGNNRLDNMANILVNPRVGLLVLVPGMDETLRINGRARLTDDERLLGPCAVQGRAPKVGILIEVEEAFVHCAKALVRAKLWDAAAQVDRSMFASYPEMLRDHVAGLTDEENERQSQIMAERGLY
jgi:PPOX class probable FMN-dependent enzyme